MSGGPFRLIHGGRSEEPTPGLLIVGASEVVTLAGGVRMGERQGDVGRLSAADFGGPDAPDAPVVACWEGRIAAVGPRAALEAALEAEGYQLGRFARLDAGGGSVTPGLIDPHTHLLFAGSREGEWQMRQRGAGYLEILEAGGGILSTVAATREASTEALLAHGRRWLDEMLGHGVTTIEAKSGYGLDLETEIRLIEAAYQLGREGPIDIVPTYLGAHAVPPEFRSRPDGTEAYVRSVIEEQLPGVAAHGRARFCDVFCENGVFSADQSRRILEAAAGYGLALRLHADELAPSGGAELAAELGAASADHLATPSEAGIDALAAAAGEGRPVVATVLPATTWFLMKDHGAPARTFIERGVPVALGTDFNPGTSPTASLPLAMTVACLELGLTPDEALSAVTINAARAIGLEDEIGSLEPGKSADLVIWRVPSSTPDPVLAGRRPGADGRQARARRPRPGLTPAPADLGLLAARFEEDGRRLERQARRRHRQLRLGDRLGAHLVEEALERLGAIGVVVADRHRDHDLRVELGDELRGPGRRHRAAERNAGDVHRADVPELLLRQEVADVAEVDGVDAIDLDDEGDLLARFGPAGVVAIGPDAGDEDLLDLVLAGAVEHERAVQARRQERAPVARMLALAPVAAGDRRGG